MRGDGRTRGARAGPPRGRSAGTRSCRLRRRVETATRRHWPLPRGRSRWSVTRAPVSAGLTVPVNRIGERDVARGHRQHGAVRGAGERHERADADRTRGGCGRGRSGRRGTCWPRPERGVAAKLPSASVSAVVASPKPRRRPRARRSARTGRPLRSLRRRSSRPFSGRGFACAQRGRCFQRQAAARPARVTPGGRRFGGRRFRAGGRRFRAAGRRSFGAAGRFGAFGGGAEVDVASRGRCAGAEARARARRARAPRRGGRAAGSRSARRSYLGATAAQPGGPHPVRVPIRQLRAPT